MHLDGIENNVILIDSVSKRYSECGIRIGALITKNENVRKAVMKFCQARLSLLFLVRSSLRLPLMRLKITIERCMMNTLSVGNV